MSCKSQELAWKMLTNRHRNCPQNCRKQVMPGAQLETSERLRETSRAKRGSDFSRTTGKCTAANSTFRREAVRGCLPRDTCISGTKWPRATDYHREKTFSPSPDYAQIPYQAGSLKKRYTKEEKLSRPGTYDIFHVRKFAGEKKIRGNTRDHWLYRGNGIFAKTLRSKKNCVVLFTAWMKFWFFWRYWVTILFRASHATVRLCKFVTSIFF